METGRRLDPETLRRRCDPRCLEFEDTSHLPDRQEALGQARAAEAIHFGVGMAGSGYNLFVLGPAGVGKRSLVQAVLTRRAAAQDVPYDWVYVSRFDDARRPLALSLPPGRGAQLAKDTNALVHDLQGALPAAFESDDYRNRRRVVEREVEERSEAAFGALKERAHERGLGLIRTPVGFALAPIKEGGVLPPDEFNALSEDRRSKIKEDIAELEEQLQNILAQLPVWQKEARKKLAEIDREIVAFAINHSIDELQRSYEGLSAVVDWLGALRADLIENAHLLVKPREGQEAQILRQVTGGEDPWSKRYRVNLLVDRRGLEGAPIIEEAHPTLENLVGRVEHRQQFGALTSDLTLIQPGALHRANGGYLILDARRLLMHAGAWEGLKRALRTKEITIESLGQALGLVSTASLEPCAIPLDVKVVLLGERLLYHLMCRFDPEMDHLFKVPADFEDDLPRTDENTRAFACKLAALAKAHQLRPLDRGAVARVVDESARLADDASKLSVHLERIVDLLRESNHVAGQNGSRTVRETDVERALAAQTRRADRIREASLLAMEEGVLRIATHGSAIGTVNGLSVLSLGSFRFGRPSRITARVRLGNGDVTDIEREVELGGPVHSKGVLILSSFLGARFAAEMPLSLSATLVFEQSYGGVDGDSASMAELCALLSALSGLPIYQRYAITGSVDQLGHAQAIGGVNEKIEGFFDVCHRLEGGLDRTQGVLIPDANVRHLMLRQEVVDAASRGEFHVYAYRDVDEAISILTGSPAGTRAPGGQFAAGTVNRRVEDRLTKLASLGRHWARELRAPNLGADPPPAEQETFPEEADGT